MREKKDVPLEIERVRRRFERWRQRRWGYAPIPKRLWTAAAKAAREFGVNRTSQALSLDFKKLKALASVEGKPKKTMEAAVAPQFLEWVAGPGTGGAECVIELEGPRGKMRIEWKGPAAPDLAGLSRMLWGEE